jgi:autotransporter-associated beta strand protein
VSVVSSPWNSADVGSVGVTGSAYNNGTNFTLTGSGSAIGSASDSFHYTYQTLTGNGVIIAHVASLTNTNSWAMAGVMFRNSLSYNDQYALECITPGNGSAFQYRTTSGGNAAGTNGDSGPAAPYWVKLVRSGNTVRGYRSSDGNTWTQDGSITLAFTNSTIYVGLAVCADNNAALATATFDHVTLLTGGDSAPTIAQAAAASSNPVTGTSVVLSALGSDANGQSFLTYTWTATVPGGASVPSYSNNGSNPGQNTTVMLTAAGSYVFQVTITNEYGLTATSSVNVAVNQTLSGVSVSPTTASITAGSTQQFTVTGQDQFGQSINNPAATWTLTGSGAVSSSGLYQPAYAPGSATVQATSGAFVGTATVTVSGQAQWNSTTDASWGAAGSWQDSVTGAAIAANAAPGVRTIAGDTVLFTATSGDTARLDGASPTLAGITFSTNSGKTGYTISQGSGGTITLQAGSSASVNVLAGSQTIAAPLILASNTTFAISSGSLGLTGNVSGAGSLTKTGAGTLVLANTNRYGTGVAVSSGKLVVINASSLADRSSLVVGNANYFAAAAPATSAAAASAPTASLATPMAAAAFPERSAFALTDAASLPAVPVFFRPAAEQWLATVKAPHQKHHAHDAIFLEYGMRRTNSATSPTLEYPV